MQAINSNDNDNDNQDPIQELPNELFTSILSLLPPSAIAHFSATSTLWREAILSSPTLHQEVDLTKLKEDKDLLSIVYHFQRLSFLSVNQLTRVSLNITPFWSNRLSNQRHKIDQTFGALDILLTTLQQSQKTLKRIALLVDGPGYSWKSDDDLLPFLLHLLRSMKHFTSLQSIWLEAPIWFSLKAGDSGGKMITVLNKPDKMFDIDSGWTNSKLVAEFMQEVKRVSGGSLTEFLPNPYQRWWLEESSEILKELLDCSSMRKLDTSFFSSGIDQKHLWKSILQSQNLESLAFSFIGDRRLQDEDVEILQVSQGVGTKATLSYLKLHVLWIKVDWNSIGRWAGDALERLLLRLDSQSIKGLSTPALVSPLIRNSADTLKELETVKTLSDIIDDPLDLPQEKQHSSVETKVSFPNLEKLCLENVAASIFQFFSNVECSKLQRLIVFATQSSLASSGFNCLIQLLETSDTTILKLDFSVTGFRSLDCPRPHFNFSSLETLVVSKFSEGDQNKIELPRWLLTSLYPNLSKVVMWDLNAEQRKQIFSNLKAMGKAPKLEIK